jgi:hypothetical protein
MAVAADDRSGAQPHRTARYTTASAGWKTTCGAWQSSRAPKGIWSSQYRCLGRVTSSDACRWQVRYVAHSSLNKPECRLSVVFRSY